MAYKKQNGLGGWASDWLSDVAGKPSVTEDNSNGSFFGTLPSSSVSATTSTPGTSISSGSSALDWVKGVTGLVSAFKGTPTAPTYTQVAPSMNWTPILLVGGLGLVAVLVLKKKK